MRSRGPRLCPTHRPSLFRRLLLCRRSHLCRKPLLRGRCSRGAVGSHCSITRPPLGRRRGAREGSGRGGVGQAAIRGGCCICRGGFRMVHHIVWSIHRAGPQMALCDFWGSPPPPLCGQGPGSGRHGGARWSLIRSRGPRLCPTHRPSLFRRLLLCRRSHLCHMPLLRGRCSRGPVGSLCSITRPPLGRRRGAREGSGRGGVGQAAIRGGCCICRGGLQMVYHIVCLTHRTGSRMPLCDFGGPPPPPLRGQGPGGRRLGGAPRGTPLWTLHGQRPGRGPHSRARCRLPGRRGPRLCPRRVPILCRRCFAGGVRSLCSRNLFFECRCSRRLIRRLPLGRPRGTPGGRECGGTG
jgi:hypothetical protein